MGRIDPSSLGEPVVGGLPVIGQLIDTDVLPVPFEEIEFPNIDLNALLQSSRERIRTNGETVFKFGVPLWLFTEFDEEMDTSPLSEELSLLLDRTHSIAASSVSLKPVVDR